MQGAHIPRLINRPEVQIVGVVEPFQPAMDKAVERYPALATTPVFTDLAPALSALRPDAVVISTPHSMHHQQIVDSLRAGAHVLCEKPLVCSVAEAESVIRERDTAHKVVLVSYQRHYQRAFLTMKAAIDRGIIGTITGIDAVQSQNWYEFQKKNDRWRIHKELSGGGQLNDSGSHIVDILLYVTNLVPTQVFSLQQNLDLAVDVNNSMAIAFSNGAHGTLSIIGHAPFAGLMVIEDITIYGSEGAIFYRQVGQQTASVPFLEVRRFDSATPIDITGVAMPSTPDDNFLAAVREGAPVMSPAECGLRVMQLSEAAWQSAATGLPALVATR
jgi:predicted dehydrogenase